MLKENLPWEDDSDSCLCPYPEATVGGERQRADTCSHTCPQRACPVWHLALHKTPQSALFLCQPIFPAGSGAEWDKHCLSRNQENVSTTLKPSTFGDVAEPGVTLVELVQLLCVTWRKLHLRRRSGDKSQWQPMALQAFPDGPSCKRMRGWLLPVWAGARASCWLLVVSQMKKSEWTSVRKSVPPITKVQEPCGLPRLQSGSSADCLLFHPQSLLALNNY